MKEVSGEELFLEEETDIDLFVESVASADSMDRQVGNGRNTRKNVRRHRQKDYVGQQRYRDVSKQITIRQGQDAVYMLISLENQSEVHYAMPVRNMLNDSMRYMRQVNQIRSYRKGKRSMIPCGI
ncbi:putative transposase YhgA-like [Clostridium sp. CAG:632]|nr:putative transposase YhgA-like [Clostridium sp. CAG:632]